MGTDADPWAWAVPEAESCGSPSADGCTGVKVDAASLAILVAVSLSFTSDTCTGVFGIHGNFVGGEEERLKMGKEKEINGKDRKGQWVANRKSGKR